jgi:cobalt/nickel transport protein
MPQASETKQNRKFIWIGLGVALALAGILSPFASPNPDGLDRVAQDLEFSDTEVENPPSGQLPFARVFDGYALRGVPEGMAIPLAGVLGTAITFGLAWGLGKLTVRSSASADPSAWESDTHQP